MSRALDQLKPAPLSPQASAALLALRLTAGLAFMHHGFGKMHHPTSWMGPQATVPGFLQFLAAFSEFGGGLAWVLGLLTPVASFGIFCTMCVAVKVHLAMGPATFVASKPGEMSYELPLLYLCLALVLMLGGPGRFALDRVIFGERGAAKPVAG